MRNSLFAAFAAMMSLAAPGAAQAACAAEAEACKVPMGTYHIQLPDVPKAGMPAVLYIHGYGGSGVTVMRNRAMVSTILARGYALIAPTGTPRSNGRGNSWSFHPDWPERRNEGAFFDEVVEDAVTRFGVDRDRILMAGFSIGGSMTSYIACQTPDKFAAYAPVAGSFWRPHPAECAGQVRLFQTHGWRDGTVPLEGRVLRNGAIQQGDVFQGLQIWRAVNHCDNMKADEFLMTEAFWRRKWNRCAPGTALEFALYPGGHKVPDGWADMALDWFEALQPVSPVH